MTAMAIKLSYLPLKYLQKAKVLINSSYLCNSEGKHTGSTMSILTQRYNEPFASLTKKKNSLLCYEELFVHVLLSLGLLIFLFLINK